MHKDTSFHVFVIFGLVNFSDFGDGVIIHSEIILRVTSKHGIQLTIIFYNTVSVRSSRSTVYTVIVCWPQLLQLCMCSK